MLFFLPTLFKEDTGEIADALFVRIGSDVRPYGAAKMWQWVKVEKIGFGLYRSEGKPFFDISLCYRKCDGNL